MKTVTGNLYGKNPDGTLTLVGTDATLTFEHKPNESQWSNTPAPPFRELFGNSDITVTVILPTSIEWDELARRSTQRRLVRAKEGKASRIDRQRTKARAARITHQRRKRC